jgi:phage FluMu protein gp41
MRTLNAIEHAHLSRRLVEAVGGLERAASICRVSAGVLSTYQNPNKPECNMPSDVVSALQIAGGDALFSKAQLAEVDQPETVIADPMRHGCDLVKEATEAFGAIHAGLSDGVVSPSDFQACDKELADLEEQIAIVRAAMRGRLLRAV